ncbi:MAG: hypothetical protein ACOVN3_09570, partial [Limnohabitans sp.]
MASLAPPAAVGTTIVIVFVGKACATASAVMNQEPIESIGQVRESKVKRLRRVKLFFAGLSDICISSSLTNRDMFFLVIYFVKCNLRVY